MTQKYQRLMEEFQDQVTRDDFERSFYTRDLASVPPIMTRLMFQTKPDLVVSPLNEECIEETMRLAIEERLAVIPRAGATTAYMNTVPADGGILIDLNRLRGVLDIDKENLLAEAWSGTPWYEVEQTLQKNGFSLCTYPSSAVAATVGGWFNTEGYGIGSMQYGCFHDQVEAAQIYLPQGKWIDARQEGSYPLSWFMGKEGTLGIVSRVRFRIRHLPEAEYHAALAIDSFTQLVSIINRLAGQAPGAYNVQFSDSDCFSMQADLGYEVPLHDRHLVCITYQGSAEEIKAAKKNVQQLAADTGAEMMPEQVGQEVWDDRLYALKIKRGGPTLLAGEVALSADKIPLFYQQVKKLNQRTAVYGHFMGPNKANILVQYYADESKNIQYLFQMAKTKRIYDAAISLGGRPYGVGIWNSVYLKRVFPEDILRQRKAIKHELDPLGIMNPGKYYSPPALLHPVLFGMGSGIANGISSLVGIGKGR